MAKKHNLRAVLSQMMLAPLPEEVRNSLYRDAQFTKKLGLELISSLPLGPTHSVTSESLHDALRAAVEGRKAIRLSFTNQKPAKADLSIDKDGTVSIKLGDRAFQFQYANLLAKKKSERSAALRHAFREHPLSSRESAIWRDAVQSRALTNDQFDELIALLQDMPEEVGRTAAESKRLSADNLVPADVSYFERLIAPFDDSRDLKEFMDGTLAAEWAHLLDHNKAVGLHRIGVSAISRSLIPFDLLSRLDFSDVETLLKAEDPFSLLLGFELCSSHYEEEEYIDLGTKFLKKLLVSDSAKTRCIMFSALAVIAAVRIRNVFPGERPSLWWVRLAVWAHAGVLANALRGFKDPPGFLDWVLNNFGADYIWGAAMDRRESPRWHGEWIDADQSFAELAGRALHAASLIPVEKQPKAWKDIVNESIAGEDVGIKAFFFGPVDEFLQRTAATQPELDKLEADFIGATSLSDIQSVFGLVLRQTEAMATTASRLLRDAPFNPAMDAHEKELLKTFANIAVSTRSKQLADAIIGRHLRYLRDVTSQEVVEALRTMIVSCAAVEDATQYRAFLGETVMKASFAIKDEQAAAHVRSVLSSLTRRDPKTTAAMSVAAANLDMYLRRAS